MCDSPSWRRTETSLWCHVGSPSTSNVRGSCPCCSNLRTFFSVVSQHLLTKDNERVSRIMHAIQNITQTSKPSPGDSDIIDELVSCRLITQRLTTNLRTVPWVQNIRPLPSEPCGIHLFLRCCCCIYHVVDAPFCHAMFEVICRSPASPRDATRIPGIRD